MAKPPRGQKPKAPRAIPSAASSPVEEVTAPDRPSAKLAAEAELLEAELPDPPSVDDSPFLGLPDDLVAEVAPEIDLTAEPAVGNINEALEAVPELAPPAPAPRAAKKPSTRVRAWYATVFASSKQVAAQDVFLEEPDRPAERPTGKWEQTFEDGSRAKMVTARSLQSADAALAEALTVAGG